MANRVQLGIQLARPPEIPDEFAKLRPRVTTFNAAAENVVEDVLNHIDDSVPAVVPPGNQNTFISQAEAEADPASNDADYDYAPGGDITIGSSRPVRLSSDWRSFLAKGVPFFNPGPEVTGPSDENEPNNPDGAATFHTTNDNQVTLNAYTGQPLSAANNAVASAGSHQLASTGGTRTYVPQSDLEYIWDFGDGTSGSGQSVQHAYDFAGVYTSKLTVRNKTTGASDTMEIPITVESTTLPGPELTAPAEDEDGFYDVSWSFDTKKLEGFAGYILEEATSLDRVLADPAENLPAGWSASEPTSAVIQPWQHSDQATGSTRGNVKHEGARSRRPDPLLRPGRRQRRHAAVGVLAR